MSREEVVALQRERMLYGMVDAVAEKGYANVSVADVLKQAGVSRETFYEQFANKEDCFLAAYEATVAVIGENLRKALQPPGVGDEPLDRLDRFVDYYLDNLTRRPTLAWIFLIEIQAAGPEAVKRRAEAQGRGIEAFAAMLGAEDERQRFACEAIFTALVGLATQRVGAGRIDELPGLRAPLLDLARAALAAVGIGTSAKGRR